MVAGPAGYRETEDQRLQKDPNRRVQKATGLMFAKSLSWVRFIGCCCGFWSTR